MRSFNIDVAIDVAHITSFNHEWIKCLTFSYIMLKNGQTFFKECLTIFQHYEWMKFLNDSVFLK